MLKIPSTTRECSLCSWHEGFGIESFFASDDVWAVMRWLHCYKFEASAMVVLRQAASHFGDHAMAVAGSDDDQMLQHLAALIASGRVRVIGKTPAATKGKGGGGAPAPAPVPPPPRPSPRPPAPRPPPPLPPPTPIEQKGNLLVEVFDDQGNLIVEQIEITASGPESLRQVTNTGTHTFAGVALGTYTTVAKVPSERFDADTRSTGSTPVTAGGTGRARLEFKWLLNIVTPKVEVEYKVVLFDLNSL